MRDGLIPAVAFVSGGFGGRGFVVFFYGFVC